MNRYDERPYRTTKDDRKRKGLRNELGVAAPVEGTVDTEAISRNLQTGTSKVTKPPENTQQDYSVYIQQDTFLAKLGLVRTTSTSPESKALDESMETVDESTHCSQGSTHSATNCPMEELSHHIWDQELFKLWGPITFQTM